MLSLVVSRCISGTAVVAGGVTEPRALPLEQDSSWLRRPCAASAFEILSPISFRLPYPLLKRSNSCHLVPAVVNQQPRASLPLLQSNLDIFKDCVVQETALLLGLFDSTLASRFFRQNRTHEQGM